MKRLAFAAAVVGIAGCATIAGGGKTQTVTFNSEPPEANVSISGQVIGKTPVTVSLERKSNQTITFEKAGYKPFTTSFATKINPWFFGNIILGGVFGSTTDAASGAMYEYSPNAYYATLVPDQPFGLSASKPRDIRQFVVASGPSIRLHIAAGEGEHLSALLVMIGTTEANRAQAIAALQRLSQATRDDLEFANKIIELYEIK